jgi:protein dithiol oxidoreductase (disulfide-forming)
MKILSNGLVPLLLALLALAGCSKHAAPTPHALVHHATDSAVAVRTDAAPAAAERATGMTEESESSEIIPAGLSPIAAAVAATTPAAASPIPSRWVAEKNYLTLVPAQPTSVDPGKVEVMEIFWYGCGHCFHLDPSLEEWRKKGKAPYVEFVRVPVMWNDATRAHARLFYTMKALGKLEQLHTLAFREIHVNGNMLGAADPAETERLQRAFLKANGVSDADFDRVYRSFSVESDLQRAEIISRRYKVTGVPLIAINGKYTADVGTANNSESQLIELINDLTAAEHKR